MSIRVKKTEHSGAKRGQGALWGRKKEAKSGSNRIRREAAKAESLHGQLEMEVETTMFGRGREVVAIHLIEQKGNIWKVEGTSDEWESGYWVVAEDTAAKLVGGDLYLHSKQAEPSHFGGTILGYRVQDSGPVSGRYVFRIRATGAHRGVSTERSGWGNEKKLVGIKSAA